MSKIALWTWAFERATTKNPMLRARRPHEALCATRRVGAHDEGTTNKALLVTSVVSRRDLRGQLGRRGVEDAHVIGHRVGAGVARAQEPRERLAGSVGEAEHRVEAPSPL